MIIKYPFSSAGKLLLEQMPNLNPEDVQGWYVKTRVIGSSDIIEYLMAKKQETKE